MDLTATRSWLHTVLQPYIEPDRTLRDVDAVLQMYNSLKPKMDTYTYDNGHTQLLLCLYGTIPITYRSAPYNIPVAFWVPTDYPHFPPIPYVKPTSNMLVRPGKHIPKLLTHVHILAPQTHNIVELISILQQVFGQEPPVYTKPNNPPPIPPLPSSSTPPDTSGSPIVPNRSTGPFVTGSPPPPMTPFNFGTAQQGGQEVGRGNELSKSTAFYNISQGMGSLSLLPRTQTPTPRPPNALNPITVPSNSASIAHSQSSPGLPNGAGSFPSGDAKVSALQLAVFDRLQKRLQEFQLEVARETDRLLVANRQLNEGERRIEDERRRLAELEQRLKGNIDVLKKKNEEMENVIEQAGKQPEVPVDEVLCGTSVVYNQLFDLVAEDNTIEDTIYYLGKALNSERMDLSTFMKSVRTLSRDQFLKRALIKKVREQAGLAVER
ncbi:UEV domain-containing protein [Endogone sp. FLAS-F59071]|nr:UEV domain-containing protein [Endogone sp. FLAS-F59071]|eukprot:RUS14556.1 UEV domain-containing protein [Endogone sp. FLAS-F59071]